MEERAANLLLPHSQLWSLSDLSSAVQSSPELDAVQSSPAVRSTAGMLVPFTARTELRGTQRRRTNRSHVGCWRSQSALTGRLQTSLLWTSLTVTSSVTVIPEGALFDRWMVISHHPSCFLDVFGSDWFYLGPCFVLTPLSYKRGLSVTWWSKQTKLGAWW